MKLLLKGATALSLIAATLLNAGAIEDVERTVVNTNNGEYDITGYFSPYHFSDDTKSNWVFVFSKKYGQSTYQLLGDTSPENLQKMGVFGWKKVSISPLPDPLFYMTRFGNGKFDWLLFTVDNDNKCKKVYKLAGQDPNTKAFSYDVDGDGKTDVLKDLTCQADTINERVKFMLLNNLGGDLDLDKAVVLQGDITQDMTLRADKLYKLEGLVKVRPGVTLTIEPGTVIFGDNEGSPDYMVVMKGAKIIANGTAQKPIVFTSKAALLDPTKAAPGQWGGLTILGNAPTNHQNPRYEVDENDPDFDFGGNDANDNSGILRHLYVLNSGITVAADQEINGLSLAGVGRGTIVEHITVKNSADDCLEVWGGTVDMKNLYLENCAFDDSLDLDYGYTGYIKGVVVKQTQPTSKSGFEISSGGDAPMTSPVIENFVIEKANGARDGGIYIKDDTTAPTFINGVIKVSATDSDIHTKKPATAAQLQTIAFKDVTLSHESFSGPAADDIKARWQADDAKPLYAVQKDINNAVVVSGDITQDTTWTKDKLYKLEGLVKVRPGVTLTIEPGTVIFGDNEGSPDYLVVMKGAKVIADGTLREPIIFTSKEALLDPSKAAPGQWGGFTILGNAPTNHTNPRYEVDENDPDFDFGGNDANDNSGIIRNVYVLNSGITVAADQEINGLSLAGVGKGTIVEHVTVKNSADDCIEIWGGTVDVMNANLENCAFDDSFDLDYGYTGYAKGIVVKQTQPTSKSGFEISSGGDAPMTSPVIENFAIEKAPGTRDGGIYIKDDTTAPTFVTGVVRVEGNDVAVHTKKPATGAQLAKMKFEAVELIPETFNGPAGDDIKARWQANDAKLFPYAPLSK